MDCKSKKMWSALATSLVAVTSSVSAVDDMQMRNLENRVSALEQRRGANGMINPPARPVVKDGCDLWLQGEALFMQATEDGLAYAIPSDGTVGYVDGRVHNAKYDWSWGFRVGAGYNMPHDGWDLFLNWTWFRSHDHHHVDREIGQSMFPTTIPPASTNGVVTNVDQAHAHLHLQMNILDLEMGREFFVSKWLTVRPHMGFRAAWLRRTFEPHYSGGGLAAGSSEHVESLNKDRGFGVRGGFDTQWGLGSGWSLYGQMAFSLLYGRQRCHLDAHTDTAATSTETWDARDRWTALRAVTDLGVGLRWDQLFSDDQYRIRLQLGWEQHLFFGFTQDQFFFDDVATGNNANKSGDLGLSGLSFQARFDF